MRRVYLFLSVLVWFWVPGLVALESEVLRADFSLNRDAVYCVLTAPRFNTTFVLPQGKNAKIIALGDPDAWLHKSDRQYLLIQPKKSAIMTSLTIITTDDRCYYFHLKAIDVRNSRGIKIHSFVLIRDSTEDTKDTPESLTNVRIVGEEKKATEPGTKTLNTAYRIKHNVFHLRRVYDDGLFTYLDIPERHELPGIFLKRGRGKGSTGPVRCRMTGSLMTIHHCLKEKERFVLMLAGKKSVIYRRGGS
jgi:type IV secretory pathway VirB9-like protein